MKKYFLNIIILIFICTIGFTACGRQEQSKQDAYYVLISEEQEVFSVENTDGSFRLLNCQYYKGEPVQIWAKKNVDENMKSTIDVFLVKTDGSQELLLTGLKREWMYYKWYMTAEGDYYLFDDVILKLNQEGKEVLSIESEEKIIDLCQLEDEHIFMLLRDSTGEIHLAELWESGKIVKKLNSKLEAGSLQQISEKAGNVLVLNDMGVWEIEPETGEKTEVLGFAQHSYKINAESHPYDMRITEEGAVELLSENSLQIIQLVNMAEHREIIVMRDWVYDYFWDDYVKLFNEQSEKYYVVMEEGAEDEEITAFKQRTDIELASGEGADIIFISATNNAYSLYEKGCFENLLPYMESSNMEEGEFFPAAFDYWREGEEVYMLSLLAPIDLMWVKEDLIGDKKQINVHELVNALLEYEEQAFFCTYFDSKKLLDYLLSGSKDLWGMIDWEQGKCDFDGELFAKILEVSKQYGNDGKRDLPALADLYFQGFYIYTSKEELSKEGKVPLQFLFDDGNYPRINPSYVLAMNSNSLHKGGVWEFFEFLLGEKIQTNEAITYPVNISAYDKLAKIEIEEGAIISKISSKFGTVETFYKAGYDKFKELGKDKVAYKERYDVTEEKVEEIKELVLSAKTLPVATEPILEIIYEEADAYFTGLKTIEEVIPVIENRVQLYLNEKN